MKINKRLTLKQGCIVSLFIYIIVVVCFYFIGGEALKHSALIEYKGTDSSTIPIGEMTKDIVVTQTFIPATDEIEAISILSSTGGIHEQGTLELKLVDILSGKLLGQKNVSFSELSDNAYSSIALNSPIKSVKGKEIGLVLNVPAGTPGNTISVWYDQKSVFSGGGVLNINGQKQKGTLCVSYYGRNNIGFGRYYWVIMSILGILFAIYSMVLINKQKKNRRSLTLTVIMNFTRYSFLLKQLVARDFKTKYKRSVLGVLWSFLNPLLTMLVQYIIFSTLFNNHIPNFVVYLLIGIVFFSFFSEATSMGLMSIIGNTSLITKVYIPKYIFPVSRVLSSVINFLISMIPLFIAALVTHAPIRPALLLLPFSIICTVVLCIGLSFILSAAMVYFRDTQFLWNVISVLWMYATPIFYPESILPQQLLPLFKMNPLYHFIRFTRTIMLDGVSPEPQAYLFCIIAAFIPLIAGILIFKKSQDKFILKI